MEMKKLTSCKGRRASPTASPIRDCKRSKGTPETLLNETGVEKTKQGVQDKTDKLKGSSGMQR
jgi:hypothetical protein